MTWQQDLSARFDGAEVSVQDGWLTIIGSLVRDLDDTDVPWELRQCKERCGILAFYYSIHFPTDDWRQKVSDPDYQLTELDEKIVRFSRWYSDDWYEMMVQSRVLQAIEQSKVTCEACGQPGKLDKSDPWHKTLCELCVQSGKGRPRYRGAR